MKMEKIDIVPRIPPRPRDAHKTTMGRTLIIAGSRRYCGAGILATGAALRGGAGLVHVAFPESLYVVYASRLPEAILFPLPETASGSIAASALNTVLAECDKMDAIAVGPGLSQDPETCEFAVGLFELAKCSAVFDADALNALALGKVDLSRHDGSRILTPHPGEYRRLMPAAIGKAETELASALAATCRGTVIYKSCRPVVCDGTRYSVIKSGTPALAHGGSGDVLTGLVTSLCARLKNEWTAALLGTHLHARAGAIAGSALTEECVTSTDLVNMLPRAFAELAAERA